MGKETRPKDLYGITYKIKTGCGNMYITIGSEGNGSKPIEVISRLGKSGGCSGSQNEALGRSISIGLQGGIEVERYIKTLKGIRCPQPGDYYEPDKLCLSCSDAVGWALEKYLKEHVSEPKT